jgi:hypothetical protein
MNDWNVSGITDFSLLFDHHGEIFNFDDELVFNSPIGNWDVSEGTNFVSH